MRVFFDRLKNKIKILLMIIFTLMALSLIITSKSLTLATLRGSFGTFLNLLKN